MKKVLSVLAIVGIVVFTGCANLGGLSDTLVAFGQRADTAYQLYQAAVASGQLEANPEISENYLKYRMLFDLFISVLKPNAAPPPVLVTAGADLTKSIDAAKATAKAKAAKKPAPTASVDALNAASQAELAKQAGK